MNLLDIAREICADDRPRNVELTDALDATITAALNGDQPTPQRPHLTVVEGGGEG